MRPPSRVPFSLGAMMVLTPGMRHAEEVALDGDPGGAGGQGRGFAQFAGEVRKRVEKSGSSASELDAVAREIIHQSDPSIRPSPSTARLKDAICVLPA